jgi:rubrerythrin
MQFYFQCPYGYKTRCDDMHRYEMMRQADPFTYPQNYPEALQIIEKAVTGEREDEIFYDYLIKIAPSQEATSIIQGIRDDERKHNKMFRKIYIELTGHMLQEIKQEEAIKPEVYCDGIKKALLGELGAVQKYRKVLFALQDRVHLNMLTEIITDELRHANLYNLLFHMGHSS